MPVHYRIDGDVLTIEPVGAHSSSDLREAWLAAEADPAYPKPVSKLRICVDARGSESLVRKSVSDMRANIDWFSARAAASSRIIAFVTKPGVQYGLVRMMAAWIDFKGYKPYVTTDPLEAMEWLKAQDTRT